MKKIFCILSLLLVFLVPFFAVKNTYVSYAATSNPGGSNTDVVYDNIYNYTANISTDYSTTFLNGITNVQTVSFDFLTYYYISYSPSIPIRLIIDSGSNFNSFSQFDFFILQANRYEYVNYNVDSCTSSILLSGNFSCNNNNGYATITGDLSYVIISDIGIGYNNFDPFPHTFINSEYTHNTYRHFSYTGSDLSYFVDLNSETNFDFKISDLLDYEYNYNVYNILNYFTLNSGEEFYTGSFLDCVSSSFNITIINDNSDVWTTISRGTHAYFTLHFIFTDSLNNYKANVDYSNLIIKNFEIVINKPVNRLENTLVLYNYDYDCAISSVNSIEYALLKDNDLYVAKYTGSLPNNKYIGITCADLQNRIYDEYIYLYITFNNNIVNADYDSSFSLGFDFNFSRYYEPFVIKENELNNYGVPTLNKPEDWWDIGGWIVYGFVWLIFYNPIISPVSRFINSIFSVFINTIQFVIGLPLGSFVLAFIGFIIIYNFFVSISPVHSAWRGIGKVDKTINKSFKSSVKEDKKYNELQKTNTKLSKSNKN